MQRSDDDHSEEQPESQSTKHRLSIGEPQLSLLRKRSSPGTQAFCKIGCGELMKSQADVYSHDGARSGIFIGGILGRLYPTSGVGSYQRIAYTTSQAGRVRRRSSCGIVEQDE